MISYEHLQLIDKTKYLFSFSPPPNTVLLQRLPHLSEIYIFLITQAKILGVIVNSFLFLMSYNQKHHQVLAALSKCFLNPGNNIILGICYKIILKIFSFVPSDGNKVVRCIILYSFLLLKIFHDKKQSQINKNKTYTESYLFLPLFIPIKSHLNYCNNLSRLFSPQQQE